MDEDSNKKSEAFSVPYPMVVECETQIRQKTDFWRLRTLGIVLRQSPMGIKSFEDRYTDPLN